MIHSILLENDLVHVDGFIDLHKAGTVCSNKIDGYYTTKPLGRMNYSKLGQQPFLTLPNE